MTTFTKANAGKLDYTMDWSDELGADRIGTSTWRISSDLTTVKQGIDSPATSTTIWLSGGTIGNFIKITNIITTATSPQRIMQRSAYIEVYER